MTNWEDIHEDFAKKECSMSCQRLWEKSGLTYQDAQNWIPVGFKPHDWYSVKKWKNLNFTPQEAKPWIDIGLSRWWKDAKTAAYCRWKGIKPGLDLNLEQLRRESENWKEISPSQEYLGNFYPKEQRLDIRSKNLTGSLDLDLNEFVNLEELDCRSNKLTSLNLSKCSKLKIINCGFNQLTSLDVSNCFNLGFLNCCGNKLINLILPEKLSNLKELYLNNNDFHQDLSFLAGAVNLERLWLGSNKLYGSLEPLKKMKKLKILDISNTNVDSGLEYVPESTREFYCSADKRPAAKVKAIYNLFANEQGVIETEYGEIKNFSHDFQAYKQWRSLNFSEGEIKKWIDVDFTLANYDFATYLKKERNLTPQLARNKLTELGSEYNWWQKGFTLEQREEWCQPCNSKHLRENFPNWTSGNQVIDKFIQKYQLAATDKDKFLEWIPYEQFTDIEYLAEGGFGKVYKARWKEGNIRHWDTKEKQWQREKDDYYYEDYESEDEHNCREVVLKSLTNSSAKTNFLNETANHKIIDDWFNNIVSCYGISQDPNTGNYLIVMQYIPEGNLRHYLGNKNRELKEKLDQKKEAEQEIKNLKDKLEPKKPKQGELKQDHQTKGREIEKSQESTDKLQTKQKQLRELDSEITSLQAKLSLQGKLSQLHTIAQGLKDIHAKNLVHRDFHSGNILKGIEKTSCLITDLGLCKPTNETSQEDKIFGVMPYVAPEVLQGQPYTQASDVYSFGIVAYEVFSGLHPCYDRAHDASLGFNVCKGLRPQFQIKIPQLLEDLIKQCWDTDPAKRPTANELEKILRKWQEEINNYYGSSEFKAQLQAAEEYNKALSDKAKFPQYKIHKGASYHSKLLPTKEITKLLQNSQLIPQNKSSELISKQLTTKIDKLEKK